MTAGSGGDDASWENWCTAFDVAQRDVQRLFHNRHVWLAINEMWRRSWDDIGLNVVVQNWFITQYVHTQCTGIRRECDARTDTSSLRRCLQRLLDRPHMADRARYESAIRALPNTPSEYVPELLRGFDQFTAGPQEPYLDAGQVQADIDTLLAAAKTTKQYTNKVVAHRDIKGEEITLTWVELDQALNAVGQVVTRYYRLRHPAQHLGQITPLLPGGWVTPFEAPWCPDGMYLEISQTDLDQYVHRPQTPGT